MNLSFDQTMITVGTRRFVFVPYAAEDEDPCHLCDMDGVICGSVGEVPCCGWERADRKAGVWREVRP